MKFLPFIILLFAIVFFAANNVLAISDSTNVNLEVTGACNSNGVCEAALGETESGCSVDCGCNDNGTCESLRGENAQNCVADCVVGGGRSDVKEFGVYIKNIVVSKITFDSANISWQTTRPTQCALFLGETSEYEKEIISETNFEADHSVVLNNLYISSTYSFKITCKDRFNLKDDSGDQYFSTLASVPNVSNLRAAAGDEKIILTWSNPQDADFRGVRMIRNNNFYPSHIEDGIIVYEGTGVSFIDQKLQNGKIYYYTVFTLGKQGNYSSGAVVSATPRAPEEIITPPKKPPIVAPKSLEKITLTDFDFYSEGQKLIFKNEKIIEVENDKNVITTIDYKKIPIEYSAIIFSFRSEDSVYSFLLKPDKEKTIYFTTFRSPEKAGIYPIEIIFFDGYNNQIKKLEAELSVFKKEIKKPIFAAAGLNLKLILIFLWLLLLLLFIILFLLIKRRKEKEKKQEEEKQNVISTSN